jgi:hypothetical protein
VYSRRSKYSLGSVPLGAMIRSAASNNAKANLACRTAHRVGRLPITMWQSARTIIGRPGY